MNILDSCAALYCSPKKAHAGIGLWADACCEIAPDAATSGAEMYASYVQWAKDQGEPVCTERAFLLYLASFGLGRAVRYGKRYWLGLHIKGHALKPTPRPRPRKPRMAAPKAAAQPTAPAGYWGDFPLALIESCEDDYQGNCRQRL